MNGPLPNGMTVGQDVQVYLRGNDTQPRWVGRVIGYYDHPTVLLHLPGGQGEKAVSTTLRWEPVKPQAHPPSEVAALVEEMFDLWGEGDDVTAQSYRDAANRLLGALDRVRGGQS
ncbi:hypothetical protein [Enterococcus hirae]|uniref:hypothetical protein n=1 Tax=Enterococcus hirae TaxID=1354 RepID=UPI00136A4916|nr:hypothetical protein [Enterococcus hirae]NAE18006.1 hypothetical protein [Enterococcus hirae]